MVSLWPWKGNDTSPASFERTLSALSAKISKTQIQLDKLRQSSRRVTALWTLYSSFAYLLCAIILALVVGWMNWSLWEYSAVSGGPLLIYLIRTAITTIFVYRIDSVASRLEEQQTERTKTIDKLKAATKYNSTQELLEKYGGASMQSSTKPKAQSGAARIARKGSKQPQRTNTGPPATANIPRNYPMEPLPVPPQSFLPSIQQNRLTPSIPNTPIPFTEPGPPEFAPNAFSAVPQYDRNLESGAEGKWYDRILDLLMGEDETSPRNRIVLICRHCRLVNGQAPPGVKRIEDLGRWRCIGCGGWNGEVDEGAKIVEEIKERAENELQGPQENVGLTKTVEDISEPVTIDPEEKDIEDEDYEEIEEGVEEEEEPVHKTRSGRRKIPDHAD